MVTTQDIARRVCDKLDRCGWVKGHLGTETDGYCVNGAFRAVMIEDGLPEVDGGIDITRAPASYRTFFRNLNRLAFEEFTGLASWEYNDLVTTSLEDVKLLVKRAGECE